MERRGFLKMLVGGVAAAAAVQAFPFRVYSFPTEIGKFNLLDMPAIPNEIAGWISYRYHMTVTLPPVTTRSIRYINGIGPVENGKPIPPKSYRTYTFGKDAIWI